MTLDFAGMKTPGHVSAAVRQLYGTDLPVAGGVIHPTAVWQAPDGRFLTLRINADTPRSRHDRFALNLCRARADALVTTGRILREESLLSPDLLGDGPEVRALAAWRREVMGRPDQPLALVLTSGRGLDLDHPFFHAAATPIILTGHEAAESLMPGALARSIEIVDRDRPSIYSALDYLRNEAACRTVTIEAGPSTSRSLYRPVLEVDELLLSVYRSPGLPQSVAGGEFLPSSELQDLFPTRSQPFPVSDPGPWVLQRLLGPGR